MNKLVIFLFGGAIGSITTYFVVKNKFNKLADEEIESVVSTFKERLEKIENTLTDEQKEKLGIVSPSKESVKEPYPLGNKKDQENYKDNLNNLGYSVGVDLSENNDIQVENTIDDTTNIIEEKQFIPPYVITEEEFGEYGNDEVTLLLYSDGVLADEDDDIIDDPETLIGDSLSQFGEFDEVMYVRNENIETDYTILRSEKTFNDISRPEVDN